MDYIFTSARLGFRRWTGEDRIPFRSINASPTVMEYFPDVLSADQSDDLVDRAMHHFEDKGFGPYAVDRLDTVLPEFIGFVGLFTPGFQLEYGQNWTEILWRLHPDHWGVGLATEGASRVVRYAFEELGLEEIYSFTTISNKRSERVMQKTGMTRIRDFDHPSLSEDHPLLRHVLYCIKKNKIIET